MGPMKPGSPFRLDFLATRRTLVAGAATAGHPRNHVTYSLALGTGQRLAEIVGLDVGDVYFPDGTPRSRVRIRPEIAKGGRAGDVFLPDALVPKLWRFCPLRVTGDGGRDLRSRLDL